MPRTEWTQELLNLIKEFGDSQYQLGKAKTIEEHQKQSRRGADAYRKILDHLEKVPT